MRTTYTDCGVFNTSIAGSPRSSERFTMSAITPGQPDNYGAVILSTTRWGEYYGSTKESSKGKSSDLMFVTNVGIDNGPISTAGVSGAIAASKTDYNFVEWYKNNRSGSNVFTSGSEAYLKVYYEEARGSWTDFSLVESGDKKPKSHDVCITSSKRITAGNSRAEIYNTKTGKWVAYEDVKSGFELKSKVPLSGIHGVELTGSDGIPSAYWRNNECKIRVTLHFPDYNRVVTYPILLKK